MSTLRNPGPFNCLEKLKQDEPFFVLKASDPLAAKCVRKWAYDRMQRSGETNLEKVANALKVANDMEHYNRNKT